MKKLLTLGTLAFSLQGCLENVPSRAYREVHTETMEKEGEGEGSTDYKLDSGFLPDMMPPMDSSVGILDAGNQDSSLKRLDGGILPDSSLPPSDAGVIPPDVGSCYRNTLETLDGIVTQNGIWSIVDGHLRQTEVGGGYRMAYLESGTHTDFDVTMMVRVPSGFGGDAHTGMLFRYNRGTTIGYDDRFDRGYILEIEEGDGSSFELTLEDAYISILLSTRVEGGFDTWHTLRVRAEGSSITGYFNGVEIFSLDNTLYSSGKIGFGSHASVSHFDDVEVCDLP